MCYQYVVNVYSSVICSSFNADITLLEEEEGVYILIQQTQLAEWQYTVSQSVLYLDIFYSFVTKKYTKI